MVNIEVAFNWNVHLVAPSLNLSTFKLLILLTNSLCTCALYDPKTKTASMPHVAAGILIKSTKAKEKENAERAGEYGETKHKACECS